MSARNKAINVKISTPKIIEALQQALDKLEVDYTSQAASEKIYDQAYEQWRKDVLALAIANVGIAQNVRSVYRSWNNIMNIDFDVPMDGLILPVEPERNYEVIHSSTYREMKEEIGNAIRILKMTDEEVVSTSTYNSVAKYL
jgi:uncharacterized protein YukE